jgi:two-component system, NtrC family, sensor kinase
LGTGTGMKVGDYFRKQALIQLNVAQQQQELLQNFQNSVLKARSHAARLPAVLGDTVLLKYEKNRFFREINEAKSLISEIESFTGKNPDLLATENTKLLKRYDMILAYYAQLIKLQLKEAEAGNFSAKTIESAQLQMLRISSGKEALLLDDLADNLTELIATVKVQKLQGLAELEEAEGLLNRIILGSMLISALIAALLARNTSRAIAQPIETVTNVAHQVALREEVRQLRSQVQTERVKWEELREELDVRPEIQKSVSAVAEFPEAAVVLNQLKSQRKKSKADLADIEAVFRIVGQMSG